MANNGKYLTIESGDQVQELAINVSAGAADADKIIRTDAVGQIDPTFLPTSEVKSLPSFENLSAGDIVNIFNDGGTAKVRKADATTTGKEAWGFVRTGVTAPTAVNVYFEGIVTGLSGLTAGKVWLDTTAGAVTQTPVTATGNVNQKDGVPISTTEVVFEKGEATKLA